MGKLFSIITITFNNRNGLKKTASSITHQTCPDYEWIIIDGGSTDGTSDDLLTYPATKSISEPDKGIYDAMNKGINLATGDYLIFMNAGDMFTSPNALERIEPLTHNKPDFIYGDSLEDNHYKRARSHLKINWGMFTHHQAMIYKRESLKTLRYNLNYKIAADYDLTLRFLHSIPLDGKKEDTLNIIYTPIPICIFEMGGVSQINTKLGRDEQFKARQESGTPLLKNITITQMQKAANFLRRHFPAFYWILKQFNKKRAESHHLRAD